jgi:hypothetical protein
VIRLVPRTGAIGKAARLVRDMLDRESARREICLENGLSHQLKTVSSRSRPDQPPRMTKPLVLISWTIVGA